jgi:transcriptional regulator with XRE-family HTH domain
MVSASARRYRCAMSARTQPVGELLREWRRRRRLSQLHLAAEAEISQRHLSFLESGRAAPSRSMVLRLAEQLSIPLRDRNTLLAAAGFAPAFGERALDDPEFAAARHVVELILDGHRPYPALAVDRHWTLLMANEAVYRLLAGVDPNLLQPPVNVLRLSLHPDGLAPRISNFREWRAHVLARLAQQVDRSADAVLSSLADELEAYPFPDGAKPPRRTSQAHFAGLAIPLELSTDAGVLSFLSTTTMFGTPVDVLLSEIAVESFFPADASTAETMRQLG